MIPTNDENYVVELYKRNPNTPYTYQTTPDLTFKARPASQMEKRVYRIIKGVNGNLEMTDENATKGFAIKGLADALNISKENIMCFGDGENDCSMLEYADYSFAMANGNDLAKSTAKFLTDTNDNAGVAKAINKYVFGE